MHARAALAGDVVRDVKNAGFRQGAGHCRLQRIQGAAEPGEGTLLRVAWPPTRVEARTAAPASVRADMTLSLPSVWATDTSSAAAPEEVSATASTSESGESARAAAGLQPLTCRLQVSISVTSASSAMREMTNTGIAAG